LSSATTLPNYQDRWAALVAGVSAEDFVAARRRAATKIPSIIGPPIAVY
jgi:hypothetical protein